MRKYLFITILLSCLGIGARGQTYPTIDLSGLPEATTAQSLRFWFDNKNSSLSLPIEASNTYTLNAPDLVEGIHVLHFQIVDNKGVAGIPASTLFIKVGATPTASKMRYWFDVDANSGKTITDMNGNYTVDTSGLVDGIHIIHYQIVDNERIAGVPVSTLFLKVGAKLTASKLRYWFDEDANSVKTITDMSGNYIVDASGLVDGIHMIHYQTVDSKGNTDVPVSKMFMKLGATVAAKAIGIQYWFDENNELIKESDIKNLTTTVDASGLGKGEHVLHYQLKLSDGTLSPAASATFETTQTLEGDANNDQKVNVADIVVIQIFIGDNTKPIHGANADVTGDGVIDEEDVEGVKEIIMTPKE